jgi:hypothetical protein
MKYRYVNGVPRNLSGGKISAEEAAEMDKEISSKRISGGYNAKERRAERVRNKMGGLLQSQGGKGVLDNEHADAG